MRLLLSAIALVPAILLATPATASPGWPAFRALFEELVETDTSPATGSCTRAAEQVRARLAAAGFPDQDLHLLVDPAYPKDGSLVAILPGTDPKRGALLLLAHIDVVNARRADWTHDPFNLREEAGDFTARGVADMKALASIWADSLIRLKSAGTRLPRTLKLALTCGEETTGAFNGANDLATRHRDLIAADFALNEGGGGRMADDGTPLQLSIQVGEKKYQDFRLEVTNPGGHSSRPRPDNAIYSLARALQRIEAHRFPITFNDTTRAFFVNAAETYPAPMRARMLALAANPADPDADAVVSRDPTLNAMLRTTCVATTLDAGHATNALPQRAGANINCRIIPGETVETTAAALTAAIADPAVSLTATGALGKAAIQPPLSATVIEPAERLARTHFPGTRLLPTMSVGATDGPYLAAAGIPVYGVPGLLQDSAGSNAHGLNERIRVDAVARARNYLFDLIQEYARAP
jgi:acetylornithine deacetylase/succinyl-diaminopimelate desuccinylase-like protein